VHRRHRRRAQVSRQRQVKKPGMEVNHVEPVRHTRYQLELVDLRRHLVAARLVEP
jgi:hypothetical protein